MHREIPETEATGYRRDFGRGGGGGQEEIPKFYRKGTETTRDTGEDEGGREVRGRRARGVLEMEPRKKTERERE